MVGIGAFRGFIRTILNIEPYSPLKPTMVGFIFIGPNSLSLRSCSCQSRDTSFKKLRLKPKFLNHGLRSLCFSHTNTIVGFPAILRTFSGLFSVFEHQLTRF